MYQVYVSRAEVSNVAAARAILAEYFNTLSLKVEVSDESGPATLKGSKWDHSICEPNFFDWPEAVKEERFDVEFNDADALTRVVMAHHGTAGFLELLGELGPHLKTALTIQAVSSDGKKHPINACEWHVEPGSSEVTVNSFRHVAKPGEGMPKDVSIFAISNKATVANPDDVENILRGYYQDFEVRLTRTDDTAVLEIRSNGGSPSAVKLTAHGLTADSVKNEDVLEAAIDSCGDEDFVALLREIAPFLKTALTVQHVQCRPGSFPIYAQEWHIAPGSSEVEITGLRHVG